MATTPLVDARCPDGDDTEEWRRVTAVALQPTAPVERHASSYRPELDGLRAVAVYAVLLFHSHVGAFSHGGSGVDVFFVLSGFLITRLLLVEARDTGGLALTSFVARRMRRLLPASWAALMLGAVALRAFLAPYRLADLDDSTRASLLWFANWHMLGVQGASFRPFLHYWSLAVEEQFYLVWPALVLFAVLVAGRRRLAQVRNVLLLAVVGTAASLAWSFYVVENDGWGFHGYYSTEARAYQLLAGAALAAWFERGAPRPGRRGRAVGRYVQLLGLVGIVLLTTPWIGFKHDVHALLITVATLAVLAGMELDRRGPAARLLGQDRMSQLGRISYGTYLWHWLVVVVVISLFDWDSWVVAGIAAVVATAVAALSSSVLEQPIRSSTWLAARPATTVAAGVLITLGLAVSVPHVTARVHPVVDVRR